MMNIIYSYKQFFNYLELYIIMFFYFIIQIGPTIGDTRCLIYNVVCKDINNPVNGKCTNGWMYTDGREWLSDPTVIVDCTNTFHSTTALSEVPRTTSIGILIDV